LQLLLLPLLLLLLLVLVLVLLQLPTLWTGESSPLRPTVAVWGRAGRGRGASARLDAAPSRWFDAAVPPRSAPMSPPPPPPLLLLLLLTDSTASDPRLESTAADAAESVPATHHASERSPPPTCGGGGNSGGGGCTLPPPPKSIPARLRLRRYRAASRQPTPHMIRTRAATSTATRDARLAAVEEVDEEESELEAGVSRPAPPVDGFNPASPGVATKARVVRSLCWSANVAVARVSAETAAARVARREARCDARRTCSAPTQLQRPLGSPGSF
jgi:hypothetical protein